ncbi:myotubularin-related protein 4 [Papilio machaon]|uniref:myotubularin-related protein 4 n=1 Tax=Papilio machaon TaxID=76193 RepID=UPI001E6655AE|nr:myotubularin-related protein 4 [Papilio machaon]
MLINTFLDTEDFVHLYYPEDEPTQAQGCGAGARMASKYPPRPPSPDYKQVSSPSVGEMSERERYRAPPQPEPPPHRVRAADLYPRLRAHHDEPGLDAGFTPICGEYVQWVGRVADGGTISMSNYRLHVQPRRRAGPGASVPLRLIDGLEIRDLLCLLVLCKHGRQIKCTFTTGEQCLEWWRRLTTALAPLTSLQDTFAAAYAAWAKEQPPASVHRALMRASHAPQRHWFGPEVERLGFTTKGAWRVTAANAEYKLCPSYPPLLLVPATIGDEDLDSVARFRAMRRMPAVVWRHRGNGAVIARSSQPEVGWLGWRSNEDERLLAAYVTACNADRGTQPPATNKQLKLLIVDARSYASAVTNRARGGGCECQQYYPAADIQFMCLPNIHHVRRSFHQLRALVADSDDQANWHSNLERTLWPQYVSGVCRAAGVVARAVLAARPVLVHCSDGWDRTPQIVAAAQLALDPYYRTVEGFRVLIEREWLDFGHKFADRCGHQFGAEDPNERSPIFLQWLDVVHQMMLQYPCSFEFNEAYLIKLATHVHSCMFGTFLCNTRRERIECRADGAAHVWHLLHAPAYRNHLYSPHQHQQVLWVDCSVRAMQPWWGMLCGEREREREHDPPHLDPPPQNGLMTKTRSCDNLLSDGEKHTTQRRRSDPSIAPDVMKLSSLVGRDSRALTDSCVDELAPPGTAPTLLPRSTPSPQPSTSQIEVEGLNPEHFSQPSGSASSSLERELVRAATGTDCTDSTDGSPPPPPPPPHPAQHPTPHALQNGVVGELSQSVLRTPDDDTPEEAAVFLADTYSELLPMPEASRESGRTRNISITWRSISESSNQSSTGFDIAGTPPAARADRPPDRPEPPAIDTRCTDVDVVNHNVTSDVITDVIDNVTADVTDDGPLTNGVVNGLNDISAKFMQVDLNGGASSSGASSESEGEGSGSARGAASQLTLRPTSPRRNCCRCARNTHGVESESCWCGAGEASGAAARVRCVCGAGARPASDPPDGLPPAADPLQHRLHQIILYQKKVVEELSGQLREAREALRRASPLGAPPPARASPSAPSPTQMAVSVNGSAPSSAGGSAPSAGGSAGGSSSGSASEVEVGEEARAAWVPDSAAPRCQHCRNHFWLARRRHHCRRCGGIFCGSCSEMSPWGECGAVRVCRRCRALR